jgi:hypothetical protein
MNIFMLLVGKSPDGSENVAPVKMILELRFNYRVTFGVAPKKKMSLTLEVAFLHKSTVFVVTHESLSRGRVVFRRGHS